MNLVLSGFGQMGQVLLEEMKDINDITIVGIIDKVHKTGLKDFKDLSETVDVIVDFSHPSVLEEMLDYAISHNSSLVIATTGYKEDEIQIIQDASKKIPILFTGNTSIGINVLEYITKQMAQLLEDFDIEIVETHHAKKIDAPSGTAKMLASAITEVRTLDLQYGRSGISKRNKNDLTIHSIRGGSVVGEHSVHFYGDDESLHISHKAQSKKLFAKGAIKAAYYMAQQEPGLYTMNDVLGK